MLWLFLTLIAVVGGLLALRRKRFYAAAEMEAEPWRASLTEEDEPLDLDEIRKAEEEWSESGDWENTIEDEPWT
jgi:hypothetical protein